MHWRSIWFFLQAEKLSYVNVMNLLLMVPLAVLWAFLPNDGISAVADWFMQRFIDIVIELPFSREIEAEADEVKGVIST